MEFLSEEWIKAYKELWNKDADLINGLKDFSAKIKYFIDKSDKPAMMLVVKDGVATDASVASGDDFDFELWASLENWERLKSGDLSPRSAMLTKKLKFKGSMITAMKYMSGFEKSLKLMGEVR